jgi:hypothetical protein
MTRLSFLLKQRYVVVVVNTTTHGCHELVLEWYVHRWLPQSGGESLSADRGACVMEDSLGHSSHLEEESKVDWLGFLV